MRRSTVQEQAARLRALLKTSDDPLGVFTRAFFPQIKPGETMTETHATRAISRFAWEWARGDFTRAVGNAPPGCFKSTIVEVMLPCLYWGLINDATSWLTIAYEASLAQRFNAQRLLVMRSELYALTFPNVDIHRDNLQEIANRAGGVLHTTSLGQSIIGKHYNFQIFGDAVNPTRVNWANANDTQLALSTAWNFYQEAATRVGAFMTLAQMIFAQRIHLHDPSGKALATFKDTAHLNLPLFFDPEMPQSPHTKRLDPRTQKGEKLWDKPESEIEEQRILLGDERFSAQYQQAPSVASSAIWKRDWNKQRYSEVPRVILIGRARIIQSWDGSLKGKKETHSRLVGQLWAVVEGRAYLLDESEPVQADFVQTLDVISKMQERPLWAKAREILIENQASGPGIISVVQADTRKYPWARWVEPVETGSMSKLQRMDPYLAHVRAGDVFLPTPELCPWIRDWENEICGFPHAPFDDRWDACSQALAKIFSGGAPSMQGIVESMKKAGLL